MYKDGEVFKHATQPITQEWLSENEENFRKVFDYLRSLRAQKRKISQYALSNHFEQADIDKFKDYISTKGMSKIADQEPDITLSELKSMGKALHLKNQAGRKIKDPIMEKNVVEWITTTYREHQRAVTRKEIREAATQMRSTSSGVQLSKGWLDKFITRNERLVREGYIRTSLSDQKPNAN